MFNTPGSRLSGRGSFLLEALMKDCTKFWHILGPARLRRADLLIIKIKSLLKVKLDPGTSKAPEKDREGLPQQVYPSIKGRRR